MEVVFATCERLKALAYINQVYPNYEDLTEEDAAEFLELVEKDIIRVQDPNMYGGSIAVVPGNAYNPDYEAEIKQAAELMESRLVEKEAKQCQEI